MERQQIPIGSNFGKNSTAEDVLAGINLKNKHVVVTGGHAGLGLETSKALAHSGALVTVASRNVEEAYTATKNIPNIKIEALDLSNLNSSKNSVWEFSQRLLKQDRHIDLLINNAGVMACAETRVGNNWELQFAVNHLGHFALTNHLWPLLKGGARVVTLSSAGHQLSPIRWNDIHFRYEYDHWLAYGQAKTANALFSLYLDILGKKDNVRSFSVHPGNIATSLQRHLTHEEMFAMGWVDKDGNPTIGDLKTPQQGAATTIWAATAPELSPLGGLYCEDCDIAKLKSCTEITFKDVEAYAVDTEQAKRLWEFSSELTGSNAF
ncbi:oxidoreductase [Acinetobacter baumannii]|nr:oxidoreductase [Acinetobacter baumannii]